LETVLQEELMNRFLEGIQQGTYEEVIEEVIQRRISPNEAVLSLLNREMK
jgi:hypothetical protein